MNEKSSELCLWPYTLVSQQILRPFEKRSDMLDRIPCAGPLCTTGTNGADPVEQFRGGGRFFEPLFPQAIKFRKACIKELPRYIGEMHSHDNRDLFVAGEWNGVAEAAAQKRVG
jgi:hypothetical protein